MAEEHTAEFIERVEVAPSGGENVEDPNAKGEAGIDAGNGEGTGEALADGDSGEGAPEGGPQEKMVVRQPKEAVGEDGKKKEDAPMAVDGETPRERALRFEVEGLRTKLGQKRSTEIRGGAPVAQAPAKKEISPEKAAILAKYKPNEIDSLREVLPLIAEDLGFVRAEQLSKQNYESKADETIQSWVKEHPEYEDESLWGRVKTYFDPASGNPIVYNVPQNPAGYKNILDRIHQDIFNIKPAGDKGTVLAQQQKIKVASAPGASGPSRATSLRQIVNSQGLRLDALSGFSDEERESIKQRAGG